MHADPRSAEQLYGVKPARYCSRCHYRNLRCLLQKVKATRKPDTFRRSLDGDLSSRILLFRVFHAFRFSALFTPLVRVAPRIKRRWRRVFRVAVVFLDTGKRTRTLKYTNFLKSRWTNENEDDSVLRVRFGKRICVSSLCDFVNIDKIDLDVQQ